MTMGDPLPQSSVQGIANVHLGRSGDSYLLSILS